MRSTSATSGASRCPGRSSSLRTSASSAICHRSVPITSAVARLRSASTSSSIPGPRSKSSECPRPASTAVSTSNATRLAGVIFACATAASRVGPALAGLAFANSFKNFFGTRPPAATTAAAASAPLFTGAFSRRAPVFIPLPFTHPPARPISPGAPAKILPPSSASSLPSAPPETPAHPPSTPPSSAHLPPAPRPVLRTH